MATAPDIVFPGNLVQVMTIANLKAVDSDFLTGSPLMGVQGYITAGDGYGGLYAWNGGSLAADDTYKVVRPNDRTPLQAGRWIKLDAAALDAAVAFVQLGDGAVPETLQEAERRFVQLLQFMDADEKTDILSFDGSAPSQADGFQDAVESTFTAGEKSRRLLVSSGRYVGPFEWPYTGAGDTRGGGYTLIGPAPPGEIFVPSNNQRGAIFSSEDATKPTMLFKQPGVNQGSGQLEIANLRFEGSQNSGIAALKFNALYNWSNAHDLGVYQAGEGDGVHVDQMAGGRLARMSSINFMWNDTSGTAKVGTGFKFSVPIDMGLQEGVSLQSKGWSIAYHLTGAVGATNLAPKLDHFEVSNCDVGIQIDANVRAAYITNAYMEGVKTGVVNRAQGTCLVHPWMPLVETIGIDSNDPAGGNESLNVHGGLISTTSTSVAVDLRGDSGLQALWGTDIINSSAFNPAASAVGIRVRGNTPRIVAFANFQQDAPWLGGKPIDDLSTSGTHSNAGSSVRGVMPYQDLSGDFFYRWARGGLGLHVDLVEITESSVASGILTLPAGSAFMLNFTTPTTISRFSAPDLIDKTFIIWSKNNNAVFANSAFIKMRDVANFTPPVTGSLHIFQNVPGDALVYEVSREIYCPGGVANRAAAVAAYPSPPVGFGIFMTGVNKQAFWSGSNWYYGDGTIAA